MGARNLAHTICPECGRLVGVVAGWNWWADVAALVVRAHGARTSRCPGSRRLLTRVR